MKLNFQNPYAFGISAGLNLVFVGLGIFFFHVTPWLYVPCIALGLVLIGYSSYNWFAFQKNIEKIQQRELAPLDFDVQDISAENEVDWEPEGYASDGSVNHKEISFSEYNVTLKVYNPGTIQNILRKIEIELKSKSKKEKLKAQKVDFLNPIKIPPSDYETVRFKATINNYIGSKGDELIIKIFSIDDTKESTKGYTIPFYRKGVNLQELQPDSPF